MRHKEKPFNARAPAQCSLPSLHAISCHANGYTIYHEHEVKLPKMCVVAVPQQIHLAGMAQLQVEASCQDHIAHRLHTRVEQCSLGKPCLYVHALRSRVDATARRLTASLGAAAELLLTFNDKLAPFGPGSRLVAILIWSAICAADDL